MHHPDHPLSLPFHLFRLHDRLYLHPVQTLFVLSPWNSTTLFSESRFEM